MMTTTQKQNIQDIVRSMSPSSKEAVKIAAKIILERADENLYANLLYVSLRYLITPPKQDPLASGSMIGLFVITSSVDTIYQEVQRFSEEIAQKSSNKKVRVLN